jgi:hypothetical protein
MHVGSAHTEVELGILMARARELLEPSGQDVLDLGVEAIAPVGASWGNVTPARTSTRPSPTQLIDAEHHRLR